MKFGLDDKIIDEIQKVFQDNWKIDSVVIFVHVLKVIIEKDLILTLQLKEEM